MGPKRVQAVRESLAGRWHAARTGRSPEAQASSPPGAPREAEVDRSVPVAELLHIDEEYRRLAKGGHLPRIAPRRYNPTREAWLPVLHTQCGPRHYTALYSNTSRAHEAGTTHDWVVIYRDDHEHGARWTVITSQYGTLRGLRVIRGREEECRAHYRQAVPSRIVDGPPQTKHQRYLDFGA
jgi:putative hydrolase